MQDKGHRRPGQGAVQVGAQAPLQEGCLQLQGVLLAVWPCLHPTATASSSVLPSLPPRGRLLCPIPCGRMLRHAGQRRRSGGPAAGLYASRGQRWLWRSVGFRCRCRRRGVALPLRPPLHLVQQQQRQHHTSQQEGPCRDGLALGLGVAAAGGWEGRDREGGGAAAGAQPEEGRGYGGGGGWPGASTMLGRMLRCASHLPHEGGCLGWP